MKKTLRALAFILSLITVFSALCACASSEEAEKEERNLAYEEYDRTGERYDYYLPDYIDVCNYTGLDIPDITYAPSETDIENYIMVRAQYYCTRTEDPDRPCQKGDVVSIITTCKFADTGETYKLFEFKQRAEGDGEAFVLGCGEFYFPALDDAVIGMRQGETKKVTIPLPDPFYKDFLNSGRELEMEITLCWIDEVDYSEATDELFNKYYGFSGDNMREHAIMELREDRNELIATYKSDYVWDYVCKNSKLIKLPEKEYNEIYNGLLDSARSQAVNDELTLLEFVQQEYGFETLDDYYAYLKEISEQYCYEDMLFYYIRRCEKLEYPDTYYEQKCLELAEPYEIKEYSNAESFLIFYYGEDGLDEVIGEMYMKDWIAEQGNFRTDINQVYSDKLNNNK